MVKGILPIGVTSKAHKYNLNECVTSPYHDSLSSFSALSPHRTSASNSSFKVHAESISCDSNLVDEKETMNVHENVAKSGNLTIFGTYRRISATKELLLEEITTVQEHHQREHRKLGKLPVEQSAALIS